MTFLIDLLEQSEGNAFIEMEQEITRLRNRNEKLEQALNEAVLFIEGEHGKLESMNRGFNFRQALKAARSGE